MDRRTFLYSLLVTFFINAFLTLFFLFPAALQRQAMPLSLIGWVMGVGSVGALLSRPIGSTMTETLGLIRSLLVLCLGLIVVSIPLIWARTFWPLFFLRAGGGFLFGMAVVTLTTYQAFAIPVKQRGSTFAWIGIAYVAPQLVVLPLAEWFVTRGRIDLYMGLAPLFALLTFLFALALPPPPAAADKDRSPAAPQETPWGSWADILVIPGFWALVLATFTFAMLNGTTLQYLPAFIKDQGLIASSFLVVNSATALTVRLFAYRLMDRLNRPRAIGLILTGMGTALFLLHWADSHAAFIAGGLLYGMFMGIGFPIILALAPDIFPPRLMPKGVSISMLAMDAGFVLAPIFAGYLGQRFGLGLVFTAVGAGAVLSGLAVTLANRRIIRGGFWQS
ncbi:MAG: MFS transporter [Syntrophales bacterium]|jgi:MFS family permease|nr:MFS transporter [Syntrophales bacterium]MDD4340063.1 MFS transporter [Syntrophales bacterium]HOG08309.1 MFS transporter [Syntrophales bacterium]HPB70884.1 MFS transporter [Syntrophales bacterium]HQP29095.1 MFS transporter [Syntrophales bacterium]